MMICQALRGLNLQADAFTSSAMVNVLGISDEWQLSMHFLKYFQQLRSGDVVSLNAAVSAFEGRNTWELAILMMSDSRSEVSTSVLPLNSGISALSWSKHWARAIELLDLIQKSKLQPTEVTWNALAAVAQKSSNWQFCCWLLHQMEADDYLPDVLSLEAALEACEASTVQPLAALLEDRKAVCTCFLSSGAHHKGRVAREKELRSRHLRQLSSRIIPQGTNRSSDSKGTHSRH